MNDEAQQRIETAFAVQADVRGPWRRYLDALAPLRPALHRYCCRLAGNVWDAEDLVQDTLLKVFGYLGKIDRDLDHPRAYLIRTATHLWIDRLRVRERERAFASGSRGDEESGAGPEAAIETGDAVRTLLGDLPARERAAIVMREVLDLSTAEAASALQMSEGAVKAALHRARERLDAATPGPVANGPSKALVERFLAALAAGDVATLSTLCSADLTVELVGGARSDTFEQSRTFFAHARWEPPAAIARAMMFGVKPTWRLHSYRGEWLVLGFRVLDGIEGLNEVHRLDEVDGRIGRIRCYCFCPDTLRALAEEIGVPALPRPYRSPDPRG